MTIYIDSDYKCHVSNPDNTYTAVETDFFDGKCPAFIEGYRFVPAGESWTREDGVVFRGEMITLWQPWEALDEAQLAYELQNYDAMAQELADAQEALEILEVKPDEEVE